MPATRLSAVGLSAVLIAAAALAGSTAAAATARPAAEPKDQASLAAVSCRGSNWCMAVGTYTAKSKVHALAQVWNGSTWRHRGQGARHRTELGVVRDRVRSASAAGGPTGAEQWNGRAWRTVNLGKPDGGLTGITCGSRASCMLIFPRLDGPEVQSWSGGTKWHVWAKATNVCFGPSGAPCGLAGVSCGSVDQLRGRRHHPVPVQLRPEAEQRACGTARAGRSASRPASVIRRR